MAEPLVFDPSKKKKRRKRRKVRERKQEPEEFVPTPTTEGLVADAWLEDDKATGDERDYTYPELLKRIYDRITSEKGESSIFGSHKKMIEPPIVGRMGSTRVLWTNFNDNCESINRNPQHVLAFVLSELGTTGSIAQDNKLVMKGRFQPKQIEKLLLKYISDYVTCDTCRSPETDLEKRNRILFKVCRTCGSQSSVANIKTGFRAQLTSRRRLRAAQVN
eukprot:TRINITY_DN19_c0_g1_i1.p1 TRINITY_DN19_c0_g1~~TRINITY_DN19_c0_g1_i1.p1  ORF type:complete len:232 (-),score=44.40 TRINITY_DN19_c0_g1_i1:34-690(-)